MDGAWPDIAGLRGEDGDFRVFADGALGGFTQRFGGVGVAEGPERVGGKMPLAAAGAEEENQAENQTMTQNFVS